MNAPEPLEPRDLRTQPPADAAPVSTPRNISPTDPRLDALLDAVLAPAAPPASLNQRILLATADRLGRSRRHGVLATLGSHQGLQRSLRVAAMLGLTTVVAGSIWYANRPPAPAPGSTPEIANGTSTRPSIVDGDGDHVTPEPYVAITPADGVSAPLPADLILIQQGLERLALVEVGSEAIDDQISLLSMQFSLTRSAEEAADPFAHNALDALDKAIARDSMDNLAFELESLF